MHRSRIIVTALALLCSYQCSAAPTVSVLENSGTIGCINANGAFAGGSMAFGTQGLLQGFQWNATSGSRAIGAPTPCIEWSPVYGSHLAMSPEGSVIAGTFTFQGTQELSVSCRFRWSESGGYEPLPLPPEINGTKVWTVAVSGYGGVVLGRGRPQDQNAGIVLWPAIGAPVFVPPPAGWFSADPTAINSAGNVVVGNLLQSPSMIQQPFRWTQSGGYEVLPSPNLYDGTVLSVSNDGSMVYGWCSGTAGRFDFCVWTNGVPTVLHSFPDGGYPGHNVPQAASWDGGTLMGTNLVSGPWIWRTGMPDLQPWGEFCASRGFSTPGLGTMLSQDGTAVDLAHENRTVLN